MKICWLSDTDLIGSGYLNITIPLCDGLSKRGHEVKVSGLGYRGTQHDYPFSIIPAMNVQEGLGIVQNLYNMWHFDALIVALDIPLQLRILHMMNNKPFKYVGIMPVEADPICLSWAMGLMQMDHRFIISEFGRKECEKVGVQAEHIQIGIDTDTWRLPTKEEKHMIRTNVLGVEDDTFVILTVADNQERKNLSKSLEIVSDFIKDGHPNTKYILVTREFNQVGWILRDLAQTLGINDKVMIFERGMEFKKLWSLYASSDVFLLTSKAEGLGMPLLEAMATGIPCVATNCTAIAEVLAGGRGLLIEHDYIYTDPFGNGNRYLASRGDGVSKLNSTFITKDSDKWAKGQISKIKKSARKYVESLKWEIAVDQLERALLKLNEQTQP